MTEKVRKLLLPSVNENVSHKDTLRCPAVSLIFGTGLVRCGTVGRGGGEVRKNKF
jgi:hypothetical protein